MNRKTVSHELLFPDRQLKLTAGMQHITNTRFFTRSASYSLSAPVLWVSGVAHTDIKRQALRPLLQFLQRTVGSRSSVCCEEIETHKLGLSPPETPKSTC